jgi:hypothetical protein
VYSKVSENYYPKRITENSKTIKRKSVKNSGKLLENVECFRINFSQKPLVRGSQKNIDNLRGDNFGLRGIGMLRREIGKIILESVLGILIKILFGSASELFLKFDRPSVTEIYISEASESIGKHRKAS